MGGEKAVLLSSSKFNTDGLALKICSISLFEKKKILVATLKVGFHFLQPEMDSFAED